MMRLAGKRLAGQTTTFDLLVLITLGATVQSALVGQGLWLTGVFVAVVFTAHLSLAHVCRRSTFIRHLVRGKPRALVVDGKLLPGQEEAHADYMRQAKAAREASAAKNAQLSTLPVQRAYTNMGAPPAADPSLTVKSDNLKKAEALLRTAEQSGDPARIKFAQDLVAKARAGR
jgi:hypothetical protein